MATNGCVLCRWEDFQVMGGSGCPSLMALSKSNCSIHVASYSDDFSCPPKLGELPGCDGGAGAQDQRHILVSIAVM
jgi:hypothetical protein